MRLCFFYLFFFVVCLSGCGSKHSVLKNAGFNVGVGKYDITTCG